MSISVWCVGFRRHYAYLFLCLIAVWSLGTWYLALYRLPGGAKEEEPLPERRITLLRQQIARVEEQIREQSNVNADVLRRINARRDAIQRRQGNSQKSHDITPPFPPSPLTRQSGRIAVLVIACNRAKAVKNHLDQIFRLRPSAWRFPVVVSQDCRHAETAEAIRAYGADALTFLEQPDLRPIPVPNAKFKKFIGYYKIARHYRWALNQTFFNLGYDTVIVTEDDLSLSVDFFEYFSAAYEQLLSKDPTLWCVSAWNDNGKPAMIKQDPKLLRRTDFFPGLGWMLTRSVWEELTTKWPSAFWDDWMRKPEQRQRRSCIAPEISRTAMSLMGKVGVSKGLYFDKHLKHIQLNSVFVNFTQLDLSYLLKDAYDVQFAKEVYDSPTITQGELKTGKFTDGRPLPAEIRLTYQDKNTYKVTAKRFGLMDDFRAGVPRTAYRGVVSFMFNNYRVFLAPPASWKEYDPTWS